MFTPNGSPDTYFFRATIQQMSWRRGVPYLLQSLVVSLLLFLASTLLFSRSGGVLSHFNSSTHRSLRCQLRNLYFLVTIAVLSLVLFTMITAFCFTLVSLDLAESRILYAAPVVIRPRTPLILFCTLHLRLFTPHALWQLSVSLRPLV